MRQDAQRGLTLLPGFVCVECRALHVAHCYQKHLKNEKWWDPYLWVFVGICGYLWFVDLALTGSCLDRWPMAVAHAQVGRCLGIYMGRLGDVCPMFGRLYMHGM